MALSDGKIIQPGILRSGLGEEGQDLEHGIALEVEFRECLLVFLKLGYAGLKLLDGLPLRFELGDFLLEPPTGFLELTVVVALVQGKK